MPFINGPGIFHTAAEYPAPEPELGRNPESSQHVMRQNELGLAS
jgi:hypothetical protein